MVWVKNVIWWQVHPLGFVGAPAETPGRKAPVSHRFAHLVNWLDHAVEMGCSGIMLGPIFASASDGDDPLDHFTIDPRLGDLEDFDHFVVEAKARGLRICIEAGFHHVSTRHRAYRTAVKKGRRAPEAELFRLRYPKDWEPGDEPEREGIENEEVPLVLLDHSTPVVAAHVKKVMRYWLSRGVDAWFLRDADEVPAPFWASVLPKVGRKHHKLWSIGELDGGKDSALNSESGLRSAAQSDLCAAVRSGLARTDLMELADGIRRHGDVAAAFAPHTFIGSPHLPRVADEVGRERAVLAAAVLFTMPGSPSVYYGDERGFSSVNLPEGETQDSVRPVMPEHPAALEGMGTDMFTAYLALIRMRHRHPWLYRCRVEVTEASAERLAYRVIPDRGKAAAKAEGQHLCVELSLTGAPGVRITDVDGAVEFTDGG